MSDDNSNPTRDSILNDVYSPRVAPDFTNVLGITATVRNTDVVRSTDYDEMMARAAQPAPVVAPSAPAANPGAPSVDLSTARTPTGERIADVANLNADSIVTFSGMETTLGVLMSMGLVARDPSSGLFRASGSEAAQEQQEQQQQEAPQQNMPLDPRSEAILSDVMTRAPATATGAATRFITDGAISDESVHQIAADLGLEPAAARERIEHVTKAFANEAAQIGAKAVGSSEVIAVEALEWARTTQSENLKQAAQRHWNEGRAEYGNFVEEYMASMDEREPERILSANPVPGRRVHFDRASRQVIVTLDNGMEMPWSVAVKNRFIGIK